MKRLLRVSLDTLICSLATTLIWFILSIFVDKSLINIFILTYPIHYLSCAIKSVFATGSNISKEKGNKDDVLSGMTLGIVFSIIVFGFLLINISSYVDFMGINVSKAFVAYSMIQFFLQTIFGFAITKLYYEDKNILANQYSMIFYLINFMCILITSILFKNIYYIIVPTLFCLTIYVVYIIIKNYKKFKFKFNLGKWIKYDSVELSDNLFLGLAYLFGINIALNYGESYALAFTFVGLITDTQWDISSSITTVAKIDISRNEFNYKKHFEDACKLVFILILSSLLMFALLYRFYELDLSIAFIYLAFHIADFIICPFFWITTVYLQLEYSALKITSNNIFARCLRLLLSFLRTPYCTVIAQTTSSAFQLIVMNIAFRKNFIVNKDGNIVRKEYKNKNIN